MDQKQKVLSDNQGMLLLEAILAIVILTISLTVIIESLVSGLRATVFTVDYSKAIILTDNVMADILRQRAIDPSLANKADFPEPNDAFEYEITTQDMQEEATQSPFKEAQVTVSWKSGQKEQGLSVVTWLPSVSPDN